MSCQEYIDFEIRKGPRRGEHVKIKCGKCPLCRIDRQREWTQRLMWEYQSCGYRGFFVTLTYSNDYLPEDNSLHYEDVQKFLKRLRKRLGKRRIKFYAAGEYGEERFRPHWHLCIFGDVTRFEIIKSWSFGRCDVRAFNRSRGRYTLKYLDKEEYLNDEIFAKRFGKLTPPCHHMSNGLGAKWLSDNFDKIEDGYLEVSKPHGGTRLIIVPRYYRDKYGLPAPKPQIDPIKERKLHEYRERGYSYIQAYNLVYDSYSKAQASNAYHNMLKFNRYKMKKHREEWYKRINTMFG